MKAPPKYELGPGREFTALADGIECIVTCPDNVRAGSYFSFRPFDSFRTEWVEFHTSNHGLILNKIPGQRLLQLSGIDEDSEGSDHEKLATLAQEKYFLRAIGPKAAPNSIESALEALQTSSYPLVLVFGPPGPPENI